VLSIQRGAKVFVNYCRTVTPRRRCAPPLDGFTTEQQIKDNLLFTGQKVGDPMHIAAAKTSGNGSASRRRIFP
jgi:ubiquinol-cytochrome c reductase cytochrome c1 subunit